MLVALKVCFLIHARLSHSYKRNFSHVGILTARINAASRTSSNVQIANHSVAAFGTREVARNGKASGTHEMKDGAKGHNISKKIILLQDVLGLVVTIAGLVLAIALCLGLGLVAFEWIRGTSADPQVAASQDASISITKGYPLELTFLRKSGEIVAKLTAQQWWSGRMLRDAVSKQLPPDDFLHSILFESDGCERQVADFSRLGELGIKTGLEMQVVFLRSWAIPSDVALLSFSKHCSGPLGARAVARLWLHEDGSANMECGEFIDVGMAKVKYLSGTFDNKGCLNLQDDGQDIEGIIVESHRRRRVTSLHVPILGDTNLQQERADAVFDVSQTSAFVGWISLFEGAEIVAKVAKRTLEGVPREDVHLRLKVSSHGLQDGSIRIDFKSQNDFQNWDIAVPNAQCSLCSAILCGPVGRRKLILEDFPLLGSVELREHRWCSDMIGV